MSPEALKALKASIAHWEQIVAAEKPGDVEIGANYCALCDMFRDIELRGVTCNGCPVKIATGESGCRKTPYNVAELAYIKWLGDPETRDEFRAAAQAELDFLKGLLP